MSEKSPSLKALMQLVEDARESIDTYSSVAQYDLKVANTFLKHGSHKAAGRWLSRALTDSVRALPQISKAVGFDADQFIRRMSQIKREKRRAHLSE